MGKTNVRRTEKEIKKGGKPLPVAQGEAQPAQPASSLCRVPPRASKLLGGMPPNQPSTATTLPSPRAPPEPPSRPWRRISVPRTHFPPPEPPSLAPSTSSTKTERRHRHGLKNSRP